ncbi:pre-peptidase C-terminal domain-containing protein [Janthinobacterium sp. 17J80-10]|uniref:pre-peptidase C-terminal domain-containing protein n=1 Tax=Janthinobacterium sp. 17J80-10 TaxID=2497863 RepID=UPI00100531C7|nr:pre-peptidase C-terminal domain-containing protein [Janthinobacterium sp. 17J80-10]QAU35559.1 hypothetical protein EKL02_16080 [Janthinobacterium sp. 17J80-10]
MPPITETELNDSLASANSISSATLVNGRVSTETDVDWYRLTVDAPGALNLTFDAASNSAYYAYFKVAITNASGAVLSQMTTGEDFSVGLNIAAAGTYYISVGAAWAYNYSTDVYSFSVNSTATNPDYETESNNSRATANSVSSGSTVTGQLATASDTDYYAISVGASGVLNVNFDAPATYDFNIGVYDSAGNLLAQRRTGSDVTFNVGTAASGTYYVSLSAADTYQVPTNPYSLTLTSTAGGSAAYESEENNTQDTADSLTQAAPISGQLHSSSDVDWYALAISAPGSVNITFDSPSDSPYYAYFTVTVTDANGNILAGQHTGSDFSFNFGVAEAGTYYVAVSSDYFQVDSNAYTLTMAAAAGGQAAYESELNNSRETADQVQQGSPISGQLSSEADTDWFALSVAAPGVLQLTFDSPVSSPYYDYFRVTVTDNAGNLLASQITGQDFSFNVGVYAPGTYYAAVTYTGSNLDSNPYALTMAATVGGQAAYENEANNSLASATSLTLSAPVAGQLSSQSDVDWYAISVDGSTGLNIVFDSPAISAYDYFRISIADSSGIIVASYKADPDLSAYIGLNAAGTYYVSVGLNYMAYDENFYSLTASTTAIDPTFEREMNGTRDSANAVVLGQSISGQVGSNADLDYFSVTVSVPGVLHVGFDAPEYSSGDYGAFRLSVFDQGGTLLATRTTSTDMVFDLGAHAAGTYYVSVDMLQSVYGINSSPYDLTLSATAGGQAAYEGEGNNTQQSADLVTSGATVEGQIAVSGDIDYFMLEVDTAGVINIDFDAPAHISGWFRVSVYDESGTLLAGTESTQDMSFNVGAHSPGTYYVSIGMKESGWTNEQPYHVTMTATAGGQSAYEGESNDTVGNADQIAFGVAVNGQLSVITDVDYFAVSVDGPDSLLDIVWDDPDDTTTLQDFTISVRDSTNALLAQWSGDVDGSYQFAASTGEYFVTIAATGYYYNPDFYNITVNKSSTGWGDDFGQTMSTAGAIALDTSVAGNISMAGDSDWFSVDLEGGMSYKIDLKGSSSNSGTLLDPLLKIYDSAGQLVQTVDDGTGNWSSYDSQVTFMAASSGTYYFAANADASLGNGQTGTYSLSISRDDEYSATSTTTGTLAPNGVASGRINFANDVDWVKVSLEAGKVYTFQAESQLNWISPDLKLSLYLANGTLVEQADDIDIITGGNYSLKLTPELAYVAPVSGEYYLAVEGKGWTGDYSLQAYNETVQSYVNDLLLGLKWGADAMGTGQTITYSFPTALDPYYEGYVNGFQPFTNAQSLDAIEIMQQWSSLANILFTQVDGNGNIDFNWADGSDFFDSSVAAVTLLYATSQYSTQFAETDVFMNNATLGANVDPLPGQFEYFTLLHEIGHAIGLDHPGSYGDKSSNFLPHALDNQAFTVMSYLEKLDSNIWNLNPGILDIATIQYLYGANMTTNASDTNYVYSDITEYHGAIWDAGGNDTLDASNQTIDARLFLTAGTLSSIGPVTGGGAAHNNVGIAFGVQIENARGGSGNDLIIGNNVANNLQGGSGNDTLIGSEGADTLDGGAGMDTADYSNAVSGINANLSGSIVSNDGSVSGTGSVDLLIDIENLAGSAFADFLVGSDVANQIYGNEGNDTIFGYAGNDVISAGEGNDVLVGGTGADTLIGGTGNDIYYVDDAGDSITEAGSAGTDHVISAVSFTLSANIEYLQLTDSAFSGTGNALNNSLSGTIGNNILDGAAGADTLLGEAGNDTLIGGAGNDYLHGGDGIDTASFSGMTGAVTASLTDGSASNDGSGWIDTFISIENLTGGAGDDTLSGDAAGNRIAGGAGADSLAGLDGNDVLQGDAGNDSVAGGNGNDYLTGGAGIDTLNGGAGTDVADYRDVVAAINVNLGTGITANDGEGGTDILIAIENIIGGAGNDTLTGDALANRLEGRNGNDNLVGGDGSDTLVGGAGFDTLNGGLGTDFADYTALAVAVNVNLATGIASADGSGATDTLIGIDNILGGTGNDTLTGDANGNRLEGRNGNDSLVGGAGNDTFLGGNGADTMDGGIGTDFLDYSTATAAVTANLATGTTSNDGTGAIDTFTGMEYLIGGSAGDFLTGDAANNRIEGRNGNDSLVGADGSDTLTGDAGNDTLDGGNAADTLIGGAGADVMDGGAGVDVLDYRLQTGGVNANLLTGTASNDGSGSIDTLANFENMIGGTGSDTLTGDAGNNRIEGLSGNDNIDGGDGADTLIGGLGADTINGGNGVDMLDYTSTGTSVTVNLLAGTASDGSGTDTVLNVENINGGSGADTLIGDAGNNRIDGSFGSDSLSGGDGNDTLIGGTGFDTLNGGNGIDLVDYTAMTGAVTVNLGTGTASDSTGGTDTLLNVEYVNGGSAGDTLIGNAANNRIEGRNGNDTITGAAGSDTLIGGAGNDVFRFVTTADGSDTLSDFTSGTDTIQVVAGNFGLTAGAAVTLLSGASTPTVSGAGAEFLYNTTSGALFFDRDGTGSTYAATQIATLAGSKTLVAADIQVVSA